MKLSFYHIASQSSNDPRCKGVTVIAFIIYPAAANSFNVESLKGQAVCKQLRDTIAKIKDNVAARMFESCLKLVWIYIEGLHHIIIVIFCRLGKIDKVKIFCCLWKILYFYCKTVSIIEVSFPIWRNCFCRRKEYNWRDAF